MNAKELLQKVKNSESYISWKEKSFNSYLSHFFCQIDANFNPSSEWEIGFYNQDSGKIAVFLPGVDLKVEDDVFKREQDGVEELKLEDVKLDLEQAQRIFRENYPKYFQQETIGSGFLTLQTLKQKTVWNFTLITKSFKFINLKINANSGMIEEHNIVELIDKK